MNDVLCACGLDVGSTTAKIVAVDRAGEIRWWHLEPAEPRVEDQVARLTDLAAQAGVDLSTTPLVATGYGRNLVKVAARTVTEITCHARGIQREFAGGGVLVDIGGQDSKVIYINPQGAVVDFAMNDKCAAGTGRFLENTAARLGVALDDLGRLTLSSREEVPITSTCTVFAESEVISLLAQGARLEPVLRGLHRSLVRRLAAMIRSVGATSSLLLSGGVARNRAVAQLLEEETGARVQVSAHPQLVGAYGAALVALELQTQVE
jgi:predicted CoA-substrate-specific enzyme activase